MAAEGEKKMITLMSSDGEEFEVEEALAMESQTIRHMIEDDCADNGIPLPNVNSKILSKVIEYCNKHVHAAAAAAASKTVVRRPRARLRFGFRAAVPRPASGPRRSSPTTGAPAISPQLLACSAAPSIPTSGSKLQASEGLALATCSTKCRGSWWAPRAAARSGGGLRRGSTSSRSTPCGACCRSCRCGRRCGPACSPRRWRHLWRSMPVLRITSERGPLTPQDVRNMDRFVNLLMFHRDRDAPLDLCEFYIREYELWKSELHVSFMVPTSCAISSSYPHPQG